MAAGRFLASSTARIARRRLRLGAAAAVALVGLCGCGGGVVIGFGSGFDDSPPSVTLAAAVDRVAAGQPIRLVAAAADESGIDSVAFYRIDANGTVRLGEDVSAPYEWMALAPADGRTAASFFARATDGQGNRADSAIVTIVVTPS